MVKVKFAIEWQGMGNWHRMTNHAVFFRREVRVLGGMEVRFGLCV